MKQDLDRTKAPVIQDFRDFNLPIPSCTHANNGIPINYFYNNQLELIHFILRIKAGSFYESKKSVANFCYSLLKESDAKLDSSEVDEYLDYYGVSYNVTITTGYINISLIIPKKNCLTVLPFVSSFLIHPEFKEKPLEILRQRKLMDLAYNKERVGYCASQQMLHCLFGNGNMIGHILCEEDLQHITTEDLQAYHKRSFCAENIRMFVAGNIDTSLQEGIEQMLNQIPNGQAFPNSDTFTAPLPDNRLIIDKHNKCLQSSLLICRRCIPYTHPERRNFAILSTILGGYFGSRLMTNLREIHGYTYGAGCGSLYLNNASIFYLESEVNVNVTRQAIDECMVELDRLCNEPIEAEELKQVKSYLKGQQLRKVDNTVSYMNQYIKWDDFGLNQEEFKHFFKNIDSFSEETTIHLAKEWFNKGDFYTIISGDLN